MLAVAAVVAVQAADGALASTAETQARLAAARPVATKAVSPPPAPVTGEQPPPGPGATTAAPRPNLPAPPAPSPKPAPRRDAGLLLLIPALLSIVALVRWLARRRRSAAKRV
ncbi:MAG: hypothetical protein DI526_10065 [Caulobacter segnis]|uniref:Uncharacterized protein n=1 Tax=Caulobacter segnis TaxID=88688 RepID=A0A2W5VGZ3_9CAUL|nr:MAG: hypothetical protein DI526_10065 [Caulobacter segnis]